MRVFLFITLLLLPALAHAMAEVVQAAGAAMVIFGGGWVVVVGYTLLIGSAVYGADQARKAAREQREQQRRAYNDSLHDRTATQIAANAPHKYILGEARVGSDIVAMFTSGDRDQYRWLVCVHAAHECDNVLEYYVAGKALGALDVDGWVTAASPDYYSDISHSIGFGGEAFSGTTSHTLAHVPIAATVRVIFRDGELDTVQPHTLSGSTVTVTKARNNYKVYYDWVEPNPRVRVLKHLGTPSDTSDAVLMAAVPSKWLSTSVLRGYCYSVVMLDLNQPEFQGGAVSIEARIRGMKLHDPRDGAYGLSDPPGDTPVWSDNPALAALWYLRSELCEIDVGDIPLADYITAANVCAPITGCTYSQASWTVTVNKTAHGRIVGEMVEMQFLTGTAISGYYEVLTVPTANQFTYTAYIWNGTGYTADSRTTSGNATIGGLYTLNGTITADQEPPAVLEKIAQSMAGGIVKTTWGCWAGAYTAPVLTVGQEDIVGSFSTVSGTPDSDIYNGVRGQYISPANSWVVTDFTPYQNAAYVSADGQERWKDADFPFTDSVHRVHNLCRIMLEDQRNGFTMQGVFSLKLFKVKIGQRITFTSAFIGQSAKVYRLTDRKFSMEQGLQLTFKEDGAATYDKADATSPEVTPNTNLPNPWSISAPSALTFRQNLINPERAELSWTPLASPYVFLYQVEYIGPNDATWIPLAPVAGSKLNIDGLPPGVYTFRIKTINPVLSIHSVYTTPITGEMLILGVPTVSGLEIFGRGNSMVFGGKHCRLAWRKSSFYQSSDIGSETYGGNSGGLDYFFKDYVIKVYTTADVLLRTEYVTDENYIYTYEHNAEDNGGISAREFKINIWQRGKYGQLSPYPAAISPNNPAPSLPAVTVLEGTDTVTIAYAEPDDLDWAGIKIWMSTTSGFTPGADNLAYDGIDTAATLNGVVPNTIYYYKYAVKDEFGDSATSDQGSFITQLSNQSLVNSDQIAAINLRPYGANGNNGSGSPGGASVLLASVIFELPKTPSAVKISAMATGIRARISGSSGAILTYAVQAIPIANLRQLTGTISINSAGVITGTGTQFLTEMGYSLLLASKNGSGSLINSAGAGAGNFPLKLNAPSTDTAGSLNTSWYKDTAFSYSGEAWTFDWYTGAPYFGQIDVFEVFSYSTDIGRPHAGFAHDVTLAEMTALIDGGATHVLIYSTFRDATTALGASEFTCEQNVLIASLEFE